MSHIKQRNITAIQVHDDDQVWDIIPMQQIDTIQNSYTLIYQDAHGNRSAKIVSKSYINNFFKHFGITDKINC